MKEKHMMRKLIRKISYMWNSLKKSKRISSEWQRKKIDEIYWMRDEGIVKGW